MLHRYSWRSLFCLMALVSFVNCGWAQAPQVPSAAPGTLLYAVEIRVGPKWDPSKQASEQLYFKEHSANLRRLRDAGHLVMGARYADKGLVVLTASDEAQVRALMEEDPSVQAGVFQYEVFAFHVFYGGTLNQRPRRASGGG